MTDFRMWDGDNFTQLWGKTTIQNLDQAILKMFASKNKTKENQLKVKLTT